VTAVRAGKASRAGKANRQTDGSMSLLEHMQELRRRLIVSLIAILIALVVAYVFFEPIFHLITRPYCNLPRSRRIGGEKCSLVTFGVLDPFKLRLQLSLYVGLGFASPIWLFQLWGFITPGLHRHERRWAVTFVGASLGLFASGAALAYLTLSKGLGFLLGAAGNDITNLVEVNKYLAYVTAMVLVFGVSFEFPLVLLMLNLTGILSAAKMFSWWRPMVFGITVFAAVATPSQDPFTMTALAAPMVLLYFASCGAARFVDRRRRLRQSAEDAALTAAPATDTPSDTPSDTAAVDTPPLRD
jgi:sec-independent protein translocase protein TatC